MIIIKTQTIITSSDDFGEVEVPDFRGMDITSFRVIYRLVGGDWLVSVETQDEIPEDMVIGQIL